MKVLQINSVCGTGSTGRIVVGINDTLTKRGHVGYIAYGRGTVKALSDNIIRIGNHLGM